MPTTRHHEGVGTKEETGESQLRGHLPILPLVPRTLVAQGAGKGLTGAGRGGGKEQRERKPPNWP